VYYWCHALIARDWFRYAQIDTFKKNVNKTFLIYNRAWSGSREYRLKFVDLLIEQNLIDHCQLAFNPIEPELGIHYRDYDFVNKSWQPTRCLENLVTTNTTALSSASADYCKDDYNATEFEVVLETLFDDERLHLTEKILRPIAVGQPFVLAATHGSLEYLRGYGFKTFDGVIDESYDTIEDPATRLAAIVQVMKDISTWHGDNKDKKMMLINQIVQHNREHFFSGKFTNQVVDELTLNLTHALTTLEQTNTGQRFIDRRKEMCKFPKFKADMLLTDKQTSITTLSRARSYYNRTKY
jgi:hypothetical protein